MDDRIRLALNQAQLHSVRKQVPMLLSVAALNVVIIMAVCAHDGLPLENYGWMAGLIAYCAIRITFWIRNSNRPLEQADVVRLLRMNMFAALAMVTFLGIATTATFVAGTFKSMLLVPMSLGFGSASIAHCLYTLRPAAIGTVVMGMVPSSIAMILIGPFEAQMLGVAMLSVGMLMIRFVAEQYDQLIHGLFLAEENRQLALVDSLTGIANRRAMMAELDTAVQRGRGFAVALIDLDGFKGVNDTYGHPAGDALLREVAMRLSCALRRGDSVGRLGGDEFIILFRQVHTQAEVAARAHGLLAALCMPVVIEGQRINFGASLGFARHGSDADSVETLLHAADQALYAAKRQLLPKDGDNPRSVRRAA